MNAFTDHTAAVTAATLIVATLCVLVVLVRSTPKHQEHHTRRKA